MAGSSSPASLPRSAAGEHNPWLIAIVVSLATFMEVLDTTIANVSLRHIAGGLGASQDEATWILTSYLISNAIVLPVSGWLATLIGRKKFYMICVARRPSSPSSPTPSRPPSARRRSRSTASP
jgi:DHA2 family multidrug resistance protein